MKTYSAKPADVEHKWIVIDAQGIMTQVTLLNPVVGASIDAAKFQFTDPQYDRQDQ